MTLYLFFFFLPKWDLYSIRFKYEFILLQLYNTNLFDYWFKREKRSYLRWSTKSRESSYVLCLLEPNDNVLDNLHRIYSTKTWYSYKNFDYNNYLPRQLFLPSWNNEPDYCCRKSWTPTPPYFPASTSIMPLFQRSIKLFIIPGDNFLLYQKLTKNGPRSRVGNANLYNQRVILLFLVCTQLRVLSILAI